MDIAGAPRRTYDVEAANQVLPEVRRLVIRLAWLTQKLPEMADEDRIARYRAGRANGANGRDGDDGPDPAAAEQALRQAEAETASILMSLDGMGVTVKDPRAGLVDFYSYRDGRLVELCWKLGELSVSHWHRIGEGFPGRKPI